MYEDTAISEDVEVGLVDEATASSISKRQSIYLREEKDFLKLLELDSDNSNIDSDSSDDLIIRPIEYYPCTVALQCILSPATLALMYMYLFHLPPFIRASSRKTEQKKNFLLALSTLQNNDFWRFTLKLHQKVNGGTPSKFRLVQLSHNPVEGVCRPSLFVKHVISLSVVF